MHSYYVPHVHIHLLHTLSLRVSSSRHSHCFAASDFCSLIFRVAHIIPSVHACTLLALLHTIILHVLYVSRSGCSHNIVFMAIIDHCFPLPFLLVFFGKEFAKKTTSSSACSVFKNFHCPAVVFSFIFMSGKINSYIRDNSH